MSNIKEHRFNNLDSRLSNLDYWDFHISYDLRTDCCSEAIDSLKTPLSIDFNVSSIYSGNTITSLNSWTGATNSGVTLFDIGLTGVDNGLILINKISGDTSNSQTVNALTGSTLTLSSGDTKMFFTQVSGNTGSYVYPIDIITPDTATTFNGVYSRLCGGFYQGFYKLQEYDYEVLPTRMEKGWTSEFWLRRGDNCSGTTSGTTLNDTYPENKGLFFYMGTRAEDKFWNCFEGLNTGVTSGCTSGATSGCTIIKESDVTTSSGVPLCPSGNTIDVTTDNGFLIYDRTEGGYLACNFTGDSITISEPIEIKVDDRNPFLIYHRADCNDSCGSCSGTGCTTGTLACDDDNISIIQQELNPMVSVIDNAIGFRIKDDGSIGVRLLTSTGSCIDDIYVTGTTINEAYSNVGLINDEWNHVVIKYIANTRLDDCELQVADARTGRLYFYVNGYLKFTINDFPEFIPKPIQNYKEKVQGVGYNMSIGGGTQGLIESVTFDGPDPLDSGSVIEKNFAGTFIGDISQFKFHTTPLNLCQIRSQFDSDSSRYDVKKNDTYLILQENDGYIFQENGIEIEWPI